MKSYPLAAKGYATKRQAAIRLLRDSGVTADRDIQIDAERAYVQLQAQVNQDLTAAFPSEQKIKNTLRNAYHKAFTLGLRAAGWTKDLEPSDTHFLSSFALEEWNYLAGFLGDVAQGRGRMDYQRRLAMYAQSVDAVFWAGKMSAQPPDVKIHWNLSPAEHCESCKRWAMQSPFTTKTLPALPRDGSSECLTACKCFLTFEEQEGRSMPHSSVPFHRAFLPQSSDWAEQRLKLAEYEHWGAVPLQHQLKADQARLLRVQFPSRNHTKIAVGLWGVTLGLISKQDKPTNDNLLQTYRAAGVVPIGDPQHPAEVWVVSPVNGGWAAKTSGYIIGVYPQRDMAFLAMIEQAAHDKRGIDPIFLQWAHDQRQRPASKSLTILMDLEKARPVKRYQKIDPRTGKMVQVPEHSDKREPAQLAMFKPQIALTGEEDKPARKRPTATTQEQKPLFREDVDKVPDLEEMQDLFGDSGPNRVRMPSLYDAVAALSAATATAKEDEATGFNGLDAMFGNMLAHVDPDQWTKEQYALAYRMCAKYKRQLANYDVDYDLIPKPDTEAEQKTSAIPMPGEEEGGEHERLEFRLRWAMGKRGMVVADQAHERSGKRMLRIYGDTFPHRATFQMVGAPTMWGHYDGKSFCWYLWPQSIRKVLDAFGEPHEDIRPDPTRRGPGPTGGLTGPGGGGASGHAGPGSGGNDGTRVESGRDTTGKLSEGAAGIRSGDALNDSGDDRTRPDVSGRTGTARPSYRGFSLEQLVSVENPEPESTLLPELTDKLIDEQREDVRLIADAKRRGEKGFLLGNGTGTGKTFVALGAVKQLGTPRTIIVVPNRGIARQWENAGLHFGLQVSIDMPEKDWKQGIHVVTYAALRDLQRDKEASVNMTESVGKFGLVILDEAHRECMKVQEGGQTARLVKDLTDNAGFSIFGTATPFEAPQDCLYLAPLKLWNTDTRGSFQRWAEDHGSKWINKQKITRRGLINTQSVKFHGTNEGRTKDMLRIRAEIIGSGKGVFRELKADKKLSTSFKSVPLSGSYGDVVDRGIKALATLPPGGVFGMARAGLVKRLLDYAKIDSAVEAAADAINRGRKVALFASNVSAFRFDHVEKEDSLSSLGNVAHQIKTAFANAGLSGELPSPMKLLADKLQQRLGSLKKIELYSGQVSEGKRSQIQSDFQAGNVDALISTIAAGGTGLSLHDQQGDAPRTQINLSLPWSGKDFQQLIGRTYRRGVKSDTEHVFLFAQHADEQRLAAIVAGKVQRMGAGVHGIVADTNAENLARFSMSGMIDADTEQGTVEKSKKVFFLARTRRIIQQYLHKAA